MVWPGMVWQGMVWQGKVWQGKEKEFGMKTIRIETSIEGMTPLLVHAFTDESAAAATSGARSSTHGESDTPREQAEEVLYKDEEGNPIIPGPNLFRCIMDAGKFYKSGRTKVTTQKSSLLPACMSIEQLVIPIQHKEPWQVDTRPVRIPATGGRILRHRPAFQDWRLDFVMTLDMDLMSSKLLREIVDSAGKQVGLGDFRPDTKGPFGKFVVTQWQELAE